MSLVVMFVVWSQLILQDIESHFQSENQLNFAYNLLLQQVHSELSMTRDDSHSHSAQYFGP